MKELRMFFHECLLDTADRMTVMVEPKIEEGSGPAKIETFDDILPYVGEASRYQWFLFILLLPFTFVYAFLYFAQFFLTLVPAEHWCTIPELEHWNFTDHEKWVYKGSNLFSRYRETVKLYHLNSWCELTEEHFGSWLVGLYNNT